MKSQAIVAYGQPLQEVSSDRPAPNGTEVVVRITHSGVCHSDVHLQDGHVDLGDGDKIDWTRGRTLPHTLGHEIEGTLSAVGPDAQAVLEGRTIGARYVVFPWIGCGECATCRRDQEHLCNKPRQLGIQVAGGYSEYVLVPHPKYLLDATGVPEGLAATYMCSGITAFSALRKVRNIGDGDAILIVGLGGVGMMGLQFARAMFPQARILGADIDTSKLDLAMKAGASAVYNSKDPATLKQFKLDTDGGAAAAIDFVGSTPSFNYANGAIRRGGEIVVVGLFGGKFAAPLPSFPGRPFSIVGSYTGPLGETREMMELVKAGKIQPIPIEARPLDQAEATLNQLRAGTIVGRVVLTP
ncbi:MAG: alcohol dehydrogenase [Alphaproteobacteria bacterium]|nr:alcohol dehydrogenase [Alphaproteobacteria bacterium]